MLLLLLSLVQGESEHRILCHLVTITNHYHPHIHYAAYSNQLEVLKFLIVEKGYNALLPDIDGNTPLHEAAEQDHVEIINFYRQQLDCNKIYSNLINCSGETPEYLFTCLFSEKGGAKIGQTNYMQLLKMKNYLYCNYILETNINSLM